MVKSGWQADRAGIDALLNSPQLQAVMTASAQDLKAEAVRVAPRGKTSEYAESFKVEPAIVDVITRSGRSSRAGAQLINTSGHAPALEWGNATTPAQHVLGRLIGKKGIK